jgi:hypothetical protein
MAIGCGGPHAPVPWGCRDSTEDAFACFVPLWVLTIVVDPGFVADPGDPRATFQL